MPRPSRRQPIAADVATPAPPLLLPWRGRPRRYVSDPHFGHENIIRFCERPFRGVIEMNLALLTAMREAETDGVELIVPGDVAADLTHIRRRYGWLDYPERHVVVLGNHDREQKHAVAYRESFGLVVGSSTAWLTSGLLVEDERANGERTTVLVTHHARRDLGEAEWNVHGHLHDHLIHNPGSYDLDALMWLLESTQHLNASVEMIGYRPRSLEELIAAQGIPLLERIPDLSARRVSHARPARRVGKRG